MLKRTFLVLKNRYLDPKFDKLPYLIFILDFIVRITYLLHTDNFFFGDATSRLVNTLNQSQSLTLIPHKEWLPFPFWIAGLFSKIAGDIFYAPRFAHTFFASLTIIPLYKLTKNIFTRQVAILTCLMFTTAFQLMLIETLTLSEPFFHFFSVTIFYFFFKDELKRWDPYLLFLCSLFICLTRFEGWGLCAIFFIASLIQGKKKLAITIFIGAILGVFYWEGISMLRGRAFLDAIFISDYEVAKIHETIGYHPFEVLRLFIMGFSHLSLLSIFIIPIIFSGNNKLKKYYFLVFLFLLPPIYKLFNKTLIASFRYFTVYSILFLPLTAFLLIKLTDKLKPHISGLVILFFFLVSISIDYGQVTYQYNLREKLWLPQGVLESSNYAKTYLTDPDFKGYVDYDKTWARTLWIVYSNFWLRKSKLCLVESHEWLGSVFTPQSFENCIRNEKKVVLILFPQGKLNQFYNDNLSQIEEKFRTREIKNFNGYKIVELNAL